MNRSDFRKLVKEALLEIPAEFLNAFENIEITVQDTPDPKTAKELNLGKEDILMGLYQGVPLTKRDTSYGNVMPDKITLFQKSIETLYKTPEEIKKAVHDTVIHEVAHYFGIGEKRLRDLGIG